MDRLRKSIRGGISLSLFGKKVFKEQIKELKTEAKRKNRGLIPYAGEGTCGTCGNKGKAHPVTSFCFVCDTDNWI